jgi:hypothetical protein
VIPLLTGLAGILVMAAGWGLLRRLGPRYRVARLLASAPGMSIEAARALAASGEVRYVRIHGRISSEEEFPDEHDRPLVFRWRRLELRPPQGPLRIAEEERHAVPFGVEERSAFMAVDAAALAEGLVVLPRESVGLASEVPEHMPPGTDPATRVRHVIEQVSAIEQADVVGVPRLDENGEPIMTAGLGRPLILSVLARPEAMRVLNEGRRDRAVAATMALAGGAMLLAVSAGLTVADWLGGLGR